MTYNATYDSDDIAPVAVDVGLTIFVVFGTFATLIGLMIAYNVIRGRKWNGKVR